MIGGLILGLAMIGQVRQFNWYEVKTETGPRTVWGYVGGDGGVYWWPDDQPPRPVPRNYGVDAPKLKDDRIIRASDPDTLARVRDEIEKRRKPSCPDGPDCPSKPDARLLPSRQSNDLLIPAAVAALLVVAGIAIVKRANTQ